MPWLEGQRGEMRESGDMGQEERMTEGLYATRPFVLHLYNDLLSSSKLFWNIASAQHAPALRGGRYVARPRSQA